VHIGGRFFVDEKKVSLDDKVSTWLPDIPYTDKGDVGRAGPDDLGPASELTDEQLNAAMRRR